ncbi:MAG TPA: ferrochelatase [Terriglobia bacterium]|nr:ferrochelatase [Terriglobia bacterium]
MTSTANSPAYQKNPWGVLLLAHGAPENLEDIPEFLLNVRGGRKLPDAAVKEITRRYGLAGGSPLLKLTNRQAEALATELGLPVYVGMRNWKPFIAETLERVKADGVERVVALCMAPHNSRTSIGLYRKSLSEACEKATPSLRIEFVENWHDEPLLVAAFREKLVQAIDRARAQAGQEVPVVFTAHSVPEKTIAEGDAYQQQVRETAALLAVAAGPEYLPRYRVAFQSQGMTAEPWIGPTVESQIDEIAAAAQKYVLIVPIGFVCDHIEILYDIDIMFTEYGKARGVMVMRSESLNDSPLFIRALGSIVRARMESAGAAGVAP